MNAPTAEWLTERQIADMLGVSRHRARSLLHHARTTYRKGATQAETVYCLPELLAAMAAETGRGAA